MQQEKQQMRNSIDACLRAMTKKDRESESASCCRKIREKLTNKSFDAICGYAPLPSEVDIFPLLREFLHGNIPLYLPRTEQGRMIFRRVHDLASLTKGVYGILEPPVEGEEFPINQRCTMLIPGRAFDLHGGRLGRGNGGYDKWIRSVRSVNPHAVFIGVCFECQIVQNVPMEAHDERMDAVVSAGLTYRSSNV